MKRLNTRSFTALCASSVLFAATASASAVPIVPNSMVGLIGITQAAEPWLAGLIVQDVKHPFTVQLSATSTVTGYVEDRVVQELWTGHLDFYYRIVSQTPLSGAYLTVTRSGFGRYTKDGGQPFLVDTEFRTDDTGEWGPDRAYRGAGAEINWYYEGVNIGTGSDHSSYFVFAATDAQAFDSGGALVMYLNGHWSNTIPMFEPTP